MNQIEVHVSFENEDQRSRGVEILSSLSLPDGEFVTDDAGDRFWLDRAESEEAALARAHVIVRGTFDGTDVDPERVVLSAGLGFR